MYVPKLSKVVKYLTAETAEEFLLKKDRRGGEVVNCLTVSYSVLILQEKEIEHILLCFACMFSIILTLEYASPFISVLTLKTVYCSYCAYSYKQYIHQQML